MKTKFKIVFYYEGADKVKYSLFLKEIFHDYPENARIGSEIAKFKKYCGLKGYEFQYAQVEKIYY